MKFGLKTLLAGIVIGRLAAPALALESKTLLSDLKPGAIFRTSQDVDVAIPEILRGMNNPSGILIEAGHLAPFFMGTTEAVCLVSESALDFKNPNVFKLPKGSEFIVKSVQVVKRPSALYVGPATQVVIEAAASVGQHLMAKLQCYPGLPGTAPITVEAFERLFSQKIAMVPGARKTL